MPPAQAPNVHTNDPGSGPSSNPFQTPEPSRDRRLTLQPQNFTSGGGQADIEAEKIARMKELLQKGDASIPKRSTTMQKLPAGGVASASFSAAGYVDYDAMSKKQPIRAAPTIVDDSQASLNIGGTSSVPAPVQSRVVFDGVAGLGLGLGNSQNRSSATGLELPQIGRR